MNSIKEFEESLNKLDISKFEDITQLILDIEKQINFDIYNEGDNSLDIKLRIKRIFMIQLLKTLPTGPETDMSIQKT